MKRLSSQESQERWKLLLKHPKPRASGTATSSSIDPFECDSIAAPPAHAQVEKVLAESLQKWKELDDRKIVKDNKYEHLENELELLKRKRAEEEEPADEIDQEDSEGQASRSRQKKREELKIHKGGWRFSDKKLILPEFFDYATKLPAPPDDEECRDRVISLLDPSKHLSYHQELWNLFASVPTVESLEQEAKQGMHLPFTTAVYNEIVEGTAKNVRLDGHSLSRLRMADRHGLPPVLNDVRDTATIRMECWRRQPKRGNAPDPYRVILEFLASQTLLDVHHALVQLAEDDLWINRYQDEQGDSSGFFFIEDVFYTAGPVDYVQPILDWIDGGGSPNPTPPNPTRRRYLGIASIQTLTVKPMIDIRLDQIQFRLATRYCHVHHGDVECALFVTDMRLTSHAGVAYPLIHDAWTSSYPTPQCEGCRRYPAMFAASASCEVTDGGPRALCESCCSQLRLDEKAPNSVELYSTWRDQPDISMGSNRDLAF
jgi:hypothetical protein